MSTTNLSHPSSIRSANSKDLRRKHHVKTKTPRLHPDRSIALAAFLGGPLAGTGLMAANFLQRGRAHDRSRAMATLGLGVFAAATLFGVLYVLALPTPLTTLVHLGIAMAMKKIAGLEFGTDYESLEQAGKKPKSAWIGVFTGLGVAAVYVAIALVALSGSL